MKLKVCGMKYKENILDVASLHPDYLGFIFYENSTRYFISDIPKLQNTINKVGVFVNASLDDIATKIILHNLQVVQLHGNESSKFCKTIQKLNVKVIKVFSVNDNFNFEVLKQFEDVCDFYLFDTKGKLPGGNGFAFNWDLLDKYPSTKPYFLSGGIGLDQIEQLKHFLKSKASKHCYAMDVNSKFEKEAGLKHIDDLKMFINEL